MRFRQTPLWCGIWIAVASALAMGCAEDDNKDPKFLGIANQTFNVNVRSRIDIFAQDGDGDRLEYSFTIDPEPPTQAAGLGGRPELTRLGNERALFSWTPSVADAGGDRSKDYTVTFKVKDERGGKGAVNVLVRVVNEGVAGSGSLRFQEPTGAGMAVDLSQSTCVDALPVSIKADLIANEDVIIEMAEPILERATLSPAGAGKTKQFTWCPTDEQLNTSLTHQVTFTARAEGTDTPISKRFLIRFKRNAGAGCAGDPPQVAHQSPGSFSGPLNYELMATIVDDVGFKSPPVLAFVVDPEADPRDTAVPDTSGWELVPMTRVDDERWSAAVPNLGLMQGQAASVYYVIIATDDDDAEGTRCDHTTESPVFTFTAQGGAGGGQTYGFCAACVADDQCGSELDRCVPLRGESFCGINCDGRDCGPDQQCLIVESIDGVESYQCQPVDLNCGQICTADMFEAGGGNDSQETAASVAMGTIEGLSICGGDVDVFSVPVKAGTSFTARIRFTDLDGDLDLLMGLSGDGDEFPYLSNSAGTNVEEVTEPCVPVDGRARVGVVPYEGAENSYTLELIEGPGDCNVMCLDDIYDDGGGNDQPDDFYAADLPFSGGNLNICRNDPDYYGFVAHPGDIVRVSVEFTHADGDLDVQLIRAAGEQVVAESLSARDTEIIEYEVGAEDIYLVRVFGATRSVSNLYGITIEKSRQMACQETTGCPVGSYCAEGRCAEAACSHFNDCNGQHGCVTPLAGLDPGLSGGACSAYCRSDLDCRQGAGYACKRFEDFSTACAPAGANGPGARCTSYQDCSGEQVCFPAPGGYCAAGGCGDGLECPGGTICGRLGGFDACLKLCQGDGDCRAGEGYSCQQTAGGRACLP